MLDPDDGPTMLRNVGDYLSVGMAQHPGRRICTLKYKKGESSLSIQRTGINVFLNILQFIHDIQDTVPTPYRRVLLRPYDHKSGNVRTYQRNIKAR
jgi:hypothetical protein